MVKRSTKQRVRRLQRICNKRQTAPPPATATLFVCQEPELLWAGHIHWMTAPTFVHLLANFALKFRTSTRYFNWVVFITNVKLRIVNSKMNAYLNSEFHSISIHFLLCLCDGERVLMAEAMCSKTQRLHNFLQNL